DLSQQKRRPAGTFVPCRASCEGPDGHRAAPARSSAMHLSNESLLVILLVGLIAGWLAGQIVEGTGFGLIGDLLIGIIGAFIGDWLLPPLGLSFGIGIVGGVI